MSDDERTCCDCRYERNSRTAMSCRLCKENGGTLDNFEPKKPLHVGMERAIFDIWCRRQCNHPGRGHGDDDRFQVAKVQCPECIWELVQAQREQVPLLEVWRQAYNAALSGLTTEPTVSNATTADWALEAANTALEQYKEQALKMQGEP